MSRGLGQIQRAIIDVLDRHREVQLSVESTRWMLYEATQGISCAANQLPTAWNTAFRRAVQKLADPPHLRITVEPRRLTNFRECIDHFPHKTLSVTTRRVRLELLPVLGELVAAQQVMPRYRAEDNEAYRVRQLADGDRVDLARRWAKAARDLPNAYSRSEDDALLSLLVKGKSLFEKASTFSEKRPLLELITVCCNSGMLSEETVRNLRAFAKVFFPRTSRGEIQLKSYIHTFAHVAGNAGYQLKTSTLDKLHERKKQFVESLPGFAPASRRHGRPKTQHSDMLNKLFDQTVFQRFQFVRLAS